MCSMNMIETIQNVVKSYNGFRPRGSYLATFTHDSNGVELTDEQAGRNLDGWIDIQNEWAALDRNAAERDDWNCECEKRIANGNAIPGIHFPGSGRNWELVTE